MEMEDTGDDSVDQEDPHEWSSQKVASFLRALGTADYFQSAADQVLQLGVDGSLFCELSVIDLEGVRGHADACHRMCEFTQNSTDARAITVAQTDHSSTLACNTL